MRKSPNRLSLSESMKVAEWLKENWVKKVLADKLTANETASLVANECGLQEVTDGNILGVLKECFPQWNFMHAARNDNMTNKAATAKADEALTRIEQLEARVGELEQRLARMENVSVDTRTRLTTLEKELGVKPMTSFLPNNRSN